MENKRIVHVVIIVIVVVAIILGMSTIFNITGNSITGSTIGEDMSVNNDYFSINDIENNINKIEETNGTQNITG
jgi:hypothetical protein